jgi:hypothetical protein
MFSGLMDPCPARVCGLQLNTIQLVLAMDNEIGLVLSSGLMIVHLRQASARQGGGNGNNPRIARIGANYFCHGDTEGETRQSGKRKARTIH